jgi:hypothetical protein
MASSSLSHVASVPIGVALVALIADISFARVVMIIALSGSMLFFKGFLKVDKCKSKPGEDNGLAAQVPMPTSVNNLEEILQAAGVCTSCFVKPVSSLLAELQNDECKIGRGCITGRITRRVEPVFVVLRFGSKVLVESSQVLEDGTKRQRLMVLAEKMRPSDMSPMDAALRGLCKELSIGDGTRDGLPACVSFCKAKEACFLEERDAASYPGLPCIYENHQLHIDIRSDLVPEVARNCGLPDCRQFQTQEVTQDGILYQNWVWMDASEAQTCGVKGLHFR